MNMQEINQMTIEQLVEKIDENRRALFALRLSTKTRGTKDSSQFRKLRKVIARMSTSLNQRVLS